MFRARKVWPIVTFTILVFLFSGASPSFSFDYDGIHWAAGDLPVTWEINQNGTADTTGEFDAIRAGYQSWENVSGSYFSQTYLGTTNRSALIYDGHNVVAWGDSQADNVLAVAYTWYDTSTKEILESDIEFQDDYDWSSTGESAKYDVQNVAIHEFGHTLLLGDLYDDPADLEKTMYGFVSEGETKKRTLHQDDIDGIRYIYPESVNQPPNTPAAPTGPDSGSPDTSYSFSATTSDPDGDQIAFKFDWGDGSQSAWTSYVNSGSSASKSHSWSGEGTYSVKVKAKDTYNAESGWSAAYSITIRMILLEIDLSLLDFADVGQGSAKSMTLRVYNAGSGTLSGTVTTSQSWITVSPSSFVGNDNLITVTIDTKGLAESITPYSGVITITSNGGSKSVEIWVVVIPTGVVAYPNPFSFARHNSLNFWGAGVAYAKLQIFTLSGKLLATLEENSGASTVLWDGRNEQGNRVARGIYIYRMGDFSRKIAIVE